MEENIEKLEEMIKVQSQSLTDDYMVGMYNGMIFAKSIFDGKDPEYIDAKEHRKAK